MAARTPEEIRQSIEANRAELGLAVERLRGEVTRPTTSCRISAMCAAGPPNADAPRRRNSAASSASTRSRC